MSIVGRPAKNHPQQSRRWGANRDVDDRATVSTDFAGFAERFGGFTLDVAASAQNTKCARYYDLVTDGLAQPWGGGRVWCNPPFSNIRPWIEKAWREFPAAPLVVMLLPANRTEQRWWQELVEPYRDRAGSPLTTEFLPGRMRFLAPGQTEIGPNQRPPFGCVLLIWSSPDPVGATLLDGLTS